MKAPARVNEARLVRVVRALKAVEWLGKSAVKGWRGAGVAESERVRDASDVGRSERRIVHEVRRVESAGGLGYRACSLSRGVRVSASPDLCARRRDALDLERPDLLHLGRPGVLDRLLAALGLVQLGRLDDLGRGLERERLVDDNDDGAAHGLGGASEGDKARGGRGRSDCVRASGGSAQALEGSERG